MSKMVEELTKWFENYGVIIPDGSSATIKNFMVYSEIATMAEELYEDFFADLEAKLAESEREIEKIKIERAEINEISIIRKWEIDDLKQQLEEKEIDLSLARNEINTLKHNLNISQQHDNVMCEQYFEKCKEINQDKISFAVEQLEKVKEYIHEHKVNPVFAERYIIYIKSLNDTIDNLINELKEGK